MKNKPLIEICCGNSQDVLAAQKGGADRVELNSAIFLGGLTPTLGSLIKARKDTTIPIIAMVRPREGGFCYSDYEFDVMIEDCKLMLQNGADGIAVGILNNDGTIDVDRCSKIRKIIGDKQAVFHRAIDVVPNLYQSLDSLISMGYDRVLTSGQQHNSIEGMETIKKMLEYVNGKIEILPGGGIRKTNIDLLLNHTGCSQCHMSAFKFNYDNSTLNNTKISFGGSLTPPEDRFKTIDSDIVSDLCNFNK